MIDCTNELASLGLDQAIRLRWVLRDIKSGRLKWSPPSPEDIQTLTRMGCVEMRDDQLIVTSSGRGEMDVGD